MAGTSEAVSGEDRLQNLLDKEEKILRRVFRANITDVKSLLEDINKLIRDTNGGDDTYNLKASLRELREIAYDTEDLLEELMFLSGKYGRQGTGFLSRAVQSIKYLSARCRAFMQVREMRARLHAISQRNSTMTNFSDRETPANLTRYRLDEHQLAPLFFEEAELVGTDKPKKDAIQMLMAEETKLKVISVVGMPGSGKTTLLRSIFNHEKVLGSFKGRPLEDIANGYLEELRKRRLIQQAESYDYGRTKSWKVHDIIHQALVAIAEEENFSTISMTHNVLKCRNIRRLSVQDTTEEFPQSVRFNRLRTLFIFKQISCMPSIFPSKKTLRALNLEGAQIDRFPKEIESLIFLRYLNLRNTKISELPNSLKNFKFLQTLDLKGTSLSKLPNEILQLTSLRHLLVYHYDTAENPPKINGVKVPGGIGKLKELRTLSVVDADGDGEIVEELKHLSQLRRLGIVKLRAADASKLLVFVPGMRHLSSVSLTLSSVDDQRLSLQDLAASPCLKRLYVRGELQPLPTSFSSLKNLVRLRLRGSKLSEDIFGVLQDLQNLADLSLIQAYDGEQLVCKQGGFRKVKILDLDQLDNLINVTVEGAMPGLEKLIIRNCEKLKTVPLGIMQLTNLKELHLFEMPEKFLSKLSGGEDCDKVKHVEYICYYKHGVPQKIPSSLPGIRISEDTVISQLPSTDPTSKGKEIAEEPPEEKKLVTAVARNKAALETLTEEFLAIVKGSKFSYADISVGLLNLKEDFQKNPHAFAGGSLSQKEVLLLLQGRDTGASSSPTDQFMRQ